jgi:glycosyltransferase involved in cell wall biosynthesis
MHILHIIRGLGLAGAEHHLIALLAGLRREGIDARLLLWVSPDHQADDVLAAAKANGIPVERWTMPHHIAPGFFLKLIRYLRRERPDLVHTHLVHAETYAIPAARLAGIKTVFNSSHNDDPFRRRLVFRPRNWLLWQMTSQGIAISAHIKQFLMDVERASPEKVEVIHYGLPFTENFQPPEKSLCDELSLPADARLIGSLCRLVPQKGLHLALDAMAMLTHKNPDLHYIIAGDGPLRAELTQQAERLNIRERVHFLGWRSDVQSLMAQIRIFVAPSLWEGFGLVFLEAMSAARPVVASNISAIPEIVADGETGLLVPPNDAASLAKAIQSLLDDPARAEKMGAAGRNRLQTHFNEQRMINQTAALYRRVVKS